MGSFQPQCYDMLPVAISVIPGTPPTSFTGLSSLVAPGVNASAIVSGPGAFVFDIAVVSPFALFKFHHIPTRCVIFARRSLSCAQESAAWIEFDSPDLNPADAALLTLSFAEWADVPLKTAPPVIHGTTFRLETNPQLYEGVRFGWLNVTATPSKVIRRGLDAHKLLSSPRCVHSSVLWLFCCCSLSRSRASGPCAKPSPSTTLAPLQLQATTS